MWYSCIGAQNLVCSAISPDGKWMACSDAVTLKLFQLQLVCLSALLFAYFNSSVDVLLTTPVLCCCFRLTALLTLQPLFACARLT